MTRPYTEHSLETLENGKIVGYGHTNDDHDTGWCDQDSSWDEKYSSLEQMLQHTGGTHQGVGHVVRVYLDGVLVDREGNALTDDEAQYYLEGGEEYDEYNDGDDEEPAEDGWLEAAYEDRMGWTDE